MAAILDNRASNEIYVAKSMIMAASKSNKRFFKETYFSFRPIRCNKNIAHLEINTNITLDSFDKVSQPR